MWNLRAVNHLRAIADGIRDLGAEAYPPSTRYAVVQATASIVKLSAEADQSETRAGAVSRLTIGTPEMQSYSLRNIIEVGPSWRRSRDFGRRRIERHPLCNIGGILTL